MPFDRSMASSWAGKAWLRGTPPGWLPLPMPAVLLAPNATMFNDAAFALEAPARNPRSATTVRYLRMTSLSIAANPIFPDESWYGAENSDRR
jgi:hypothetical protein